MPLTESESYAIAGLLGAAGLAGLLSLFGGSQRAPGGGGPPPPVVIPGEYLSNPHAVSIWTPQGSVQPGQAVTVPTNGEDFQIAVVDPTCDYAGQGRETFVNAAIVQNQGGVVQTVMASGTGGTILPPSDAIHSYHLLSPNQPQPQGAPGNSLALYYWPGTLVGPICGAPPAPGPGSLVLAIYQKYDPVRYPGSQPSDADGYSSPSCGSAPGSTPYSRTPRVPIRQMVWPDVITFV